MASLEQKIAAEVKMRKVIEDNGLPEPDVVEYGYTCIRLYWKDPRIVLVVDIDPIPAECEDERIGMDLADVARWEEDEAP